MTELKCVPKAGASAEGEVTYVWVCSQKHQRTGNQKARGMVHAAPEKKEGDPMFVPWGDIVESPLRLIKRIFRPS